MARQRAVVEAAIAQANHARGSLNVGIVGQPVINRRKGRGINWNTTDQLSPQVFRSHPAISLVMNPQEVGVSGLATNEPGKAPAAGWDGENGAAAPSIIKTI